MVLDGICVVVTTHLFLKTHFKKRACAVFTTFNLVVFFSLVALSRARTAKTTKKHGRWKNGTWRDSHFLDREKCPCISSR